MSFKNTTPEQVGISSKQVLRYLKRLENTKFPIHSLIMARGDNIFAEYYWKPFHRDYCHRMYSQTKSYVGIAVGELAKRGKLSLDDKIIDYFPDKLPEEVHPFWKEQTIRHMLTMHTCTNGGTWFVPSCTDRLKTYFASTPCRYPGTVFCYDSSGSFVLGVLVERLTGKTFLEYLREICLDEIGFSKDAYVLYCPGGEAWADSALLCKPRDMALFCRLLANGGKWNGKQLLDPDNVKEATTKQVDNNCFGVNTFKGLGYGHQIWMSDDGAFAFQGMHGQHTIYHPKSDILITVTGSYAENYAQMICEHIYRGFFDDVAFTADALPLNSADYQELADYTADLSLFALEGEPHSDLEKQLNNVIFKAEPNGTRITEFSFEFDGYGGVFHYENAQGKKDLRFGLCYNEFQPFPQTGYSKEMGNAPCEGHTYDCAVSATWRQPNKLGIYVQVIDEYFGSLEMEFAFNGDYVVVNMVHTAEAFLTEYWGQFIAKKAD